MLLCLLEARSGQLMDRNLAFAMNGGVRRSRLGRLVSVPVPVLPAAMLVPWAVDLRPGELAEAES